MNYFRDLVGQDILRQELSAERAKGRLNHAYLFEGPAGTGRLSVARALAARMLCADPAGEEACGVCEHCRLFAGGNHPDYLQLPRDVRELGIRHFAEREKSASGETINHDPVLVFLHLKPVMAERRICVIPDAERMRPEAANAFLKTLEEPPGGSLILLTTSARDRLLATIVSRCRRVAVRPLQTAHLIEEIVRREIADAAAAPALATLAQGSLGAAMELTGEEVLETWNWMENALEERTYPGAVALGRELVQRISSVKDANDRRMFACRLLDMLALRIRHAMRAGLSPRAGSRALGTLWTAAERILANVRPELCLRAAALNLMAALQRG